jgi:two-component system, cell cycle response regulator DivK
VFAPEELRACESEGYQIQAGNPSIKRYGKTDPPGTCATTRTQAGVSKPVRLLAPGAESDRLAPPQPILIETSNMSTEINEQSDAPATILVVDDFDDTRLLLRTWLERKGFRVLEAENGKHAIAAAKAERPDLIIMDVEMPEMDGLAATRKLRELNDFAAVPIVAVSAYGADQFRDYALAAGCNEYVSTPFEPDELETLIRALVK